MVHRFGADDRGKPVLAGDGSVVGTVARIEGDQAWVRPRDGLLTGTGSWLSGSLEAVDLFRLDPSNVHRIDERAVHVAAPMGRDDRTVPSLQ